MKFTPHFDYAFHLRIKVEKTLQGRELMNRTFQYNFAQKCFYKFSLWICWNKNSSCRSSLLNNCYELNLLYVMVFFGEMNSGECWQATLIHSKLAVFLIYGKTIEWGCSLGVENQNFISLPKNKYNWNSIHVFHLIVFLSKNSDCVDLQSLQS